MGSGQRERGALDRIRGEADLLLYGGTAAPGMLAAGAPVPPQFRRRV